MMQRFSVSSNDKCSDDAKSRDELLKKSKDSEINYNFKESNESRKRSHDDDELEHSEVKKKKSKHSKKHSKKSSKKEKKSKKHKDKKKNKKQSARSSSDSSSESSSSVDSDDDAPRSSITGKKIHLKREVTLEDRMLAIEREVKRQFMNSQY